MGIGAGFNGGVKSSAVLGTIPGDVSTLLVAAPKGKVCKLVRFGTSTVSGALERVYKGDKVELELGRGRGSRGDSKEGGGADGVSSVSVLGASGHVEEKIDFYSNVTCIAVREVQMLLPSDGSTRSSSSSSSPSASEEKKGDGERDHADEGKGDEGSRGASSPKRGGASSSSGGSSAWSSVGSSAPLVLIGHSDGSVDLHQIDIEAPLQTWNLTHYEPMGDGGKAAGGSRGGGGASNSSKTCSVVMVKWCSRRAATFFVADSLGRLYLFDLLQNPFAPVHVEAGPVGKVGPNTVDLSRPRHGSNAVFAVVSSLERGVSGGASLFVRRVSDDVSRSPVPAAALSSTSATIKGENEEAQLRKVCCHYCAHNGSIIMVV